MPKKQLLTYGLFLLCFSTFAQKSLYRHPSILGLNFNLHDFKNKNLFGSAGNMYPGLSFAFLSGINSRMDYQINFGGSFADSVSKSRPSSTEKTLLLKAETSIRIRLFNQQKAVQPFIQTGVGMASYQSKLSSYLLIGPGIQFSFKDIYVTTAVYYLPSLSSSLNSHYVYTIGIAGLIGRKQIISPKKKPLPVIPTVIAKDTDGDGLVDSIDACPTVAGLAKFRGCPDRDNDGIEDRLDKCPDVPGLERYAGCPIPDRDKDGINDEEDKCVDVPGVLRYNGCPVPDTDGDGINDEEDSCETVKGVKENHGCPPVKEIQAQLNLAARHIYFATGSYTLLPKSFASLNEVATLVKQNSSIALSIDGHTDDVGKKEANQRLSENRAKAVLTYLIAQGVDATKVSSAGYGQTKPVASNKTASGRLQNRRVELNLVNR